MEDKCPKCGAEVEREKSSDENRDYFSCESFRNKCDRDFIQSYHCLSRQLSQAKSQIADLETKYGIAIEWRDGAFKAERLQYRECFHLKKRVAELETVVGKLVSAGEAMLKPVDNDCWYDHDMNCQAHSLQPGPECEVVLMKEAIQAAKAAKEK